MEHWVKTAKSATGKQVLWNLETGTIQQTIETEKIYNALPISPDGKTVCQVGVKHIRFHHLQGRNMKSQRGVLRRKGNIQPFLAVEYLGNTAMVGTTDGHIYQFVDNELKSAFSAHTGATYALYSCDSGLVSGGKDGLVKLWNAAMDLVETAFAQQSHRLQNPSRWLLGPRPKQ